MPYKCNPCDCPEMHYRDSMSWRKAMITLLCELIGLTEETAEPSTNAGFTEMVSKGQADIGAAYTLATDLPDNTRQVMFDNQTDGDVKVSMDGGAHDTYWIQSGQVLTINFFAIARVTSAIIHLKDGTVAPTQGQFLIYAMG